MNISQRDISHEFCCCLPNGMYTAEETRGMNTSDHRQRETEEKPQK